MGETATQALDIKELLLGGKADAAQYAQLRAAQAQSPAHRRQLESLVIELMENPTVDGKELSGEEAALAIGAGLWALGRVEEALASLANAGSPEADYFTGLCHLEAGHYAKALEALERAQRGKAATKRLAALAHVEAMAKSGRVDAALAAARALARSRPNDAQAHHVLGLCLDLAGRYEDAAAEYEKAIELSPGHAAASFRLGYIEALRGEPERAREHYEAVTGSDAAYVNALVNLGVLYEDERDFDKAIECYREALRVDPTHPRARMFLKDAHASLDMVYDEDRQRELERHAKLMEIPVTDFEFSVRVRNCLQRMNIHTLGDLCSLTEEELLNSRNFGETSLQEIKEVLQARGLRLGEAREEAPAPLVAGPVAAPVAPGGVGAAEAILATPISELNLSMRSRKCMERLGIATIGQLVQHTAEELLASRNFGRTSLNEVNEKLARYGLGLKESIEEVEDEDDLDLPEEQLVMPDEESEAADDDMD